MLQTIDELYCTDLPTKPEPEIGKILVTGATGYIGGRLVPELIARGYKVRILVRKSSPELIKRWPGVEVFVGDALIPDDILKAMDGIHTAYYLIHSLLLGKKEFEIIDIQVAANFRNAAERQNIKRIIYLGGLGDTNTKLSSHLENRIKVAQELSNGIIPVTVLRAGMIIGSGSASFEILKNLVVNTPVFFIPKWAKTRSQPISIRGVIKYLVGLMEIEETTGKNFDIGGNEIFTYDEMLRALADLLGKKRYFFPGLITNTSFYGYFASLLTPVPAPITKALIAGCKNEVLCKNNEIKKYLDIKLLSFKEASLRALSSEEKDKISTRWSDAYPPVHNIALKLHELNYSPKYSRSYILLTHKDPAAIFSSFCKVGGKNGWFNNNWIWRIRGAVDRILMGVGTARGRRSGTTLRVDDVIDFWRVENIVENNTLLLRAEMKLPGKEWLEFYVDRACGINRFLVNTYFEPNGIRGFLYWFGLLPIRNLVFKDLLKQIERKS